MTPERSRNLMSLMVALDDTPASVAAGCFALALAKAHGASLAGVSVLDIDYLTAPEPVAIGTAHYKLQADLARLKRARERNERLSSRFLELCGAQNIRCDVLGLEGSPAEQLCGVAGAHDMIVIGNDCSFHGEPGDGPAEAVERLLRENPRPLVVTPAVAGDPARIVVAYDGSVAAARALQLFTLLGLEHTADIHVVSVASRQEVADRNATQAAGYLKLHGSVCRPLAIATSADPAELVSAEARAVGAGFVVMGAYGHRSWREALLGSFTTRLLSDSPAALFIHH